MVELLTDEYMSSEESGRENDSVIYVVKEIPWESRKLTKRKETLAKV